MKLNTIRNPDKIKALHKLIVILVHTYSIRIIKQELITSNIYL